MEAIINILIFSGIGIVSIIVCLVLLFAYFESKWGD